MQADTVPTSFGPCPSMVVLVLSSLHLPAEDFQMLMRMHYGRQPNPLAVFFRAPCFFAGFLLHWESDANLAEEFQHMTPATIELLKQMQKDGICYVRFDENARTLDTLPVYPAPVPHTTYHAPSEYTRISN